ncbi:MAG: alpha/beta fold hydrolase [Lachnospiraceae bacterium]|nr:alpha/beta fold hydrolase [Lachnospiraceae bacterium]
MSKTLKIALVIVGIILLLVILAALILPKPISMSIYNDNFGKRFTTGEIYAFRVDDFDGLSREKYTFTSDKGQMLTGYKYYRSSESPKGMVVLAHGFGGGGHRAYMNIANYFATNGYWVFAYDATGNDESEGDAVGGLPQGIIDLDYAIRFVKSEFPNLPIVLWGHSWGGYSVGSVTKLHPDVKAAVIVSGFNESLDMLECEGRKIVGNIIDFVLPIFIKHEKKSFGEYASMSILDSLASTEVPALFVHSEDDEMIPIEISFDRYFEKFSGDDRFSFIRYKDKGHNFIFCSENRKAYVEEYNKGANAYTESMGGQLTEEQATAYIRENFDKTKGFELDAELMAQMLELYNNSIEQ